MRGVNYPYAWYKDSQDTQQMLADIASTGANAVRVVLATGDQWTRTSAAELVNIISWAKTNKLVAMLEVHDATGYGDNEAPHPNVSLDYWTSDDIASTLKGQEAYVLLNVANESFGNDKSEEWEEFYEAGVGELRAAGLRHTLVVDAPFWGQDWGNCMRDGSTTNPRTMSCDSNAIFDADPEANTVFSVHMYDVYAEAGVVAEYFDKFLMRGLPFVVGEFAADHGPGKNVDEASIMQLAEERKIGYLGWSWAGNSTSPTDLSSLDITVGFDVSNLTAWGETLINGANGLKETGVPCTCFD
jgi:mannan endo-1,4-beta-mannosidase